MIAPSIPLVGPDGRVKFEVRTHVGFTQSEPMLEVDIGDGFFGRKNDVDIKEVNIIFSC